MGKESLCALILHWIQQSRRAGCRINQGMVKHTRHSLGADSSVRPPKMNPSRDRTPGIVISCVKS